ncbi:MAG TPA: peptidoglycan DD-metalloendopeptidase family protein [Burkholderiaceae bacterium]
MKPTRIASLTLLLAACAACTTTRPLAPVVERTLPAGPEKKAAPEKAEAKPDAPGYYTVKKGDTLLRIALDFGLNYRDLVAWNNLSNPNDIKADQVLRIAAPEGGAVTAAVTRPEATEIKKAPPVPAAVVAAAKTGPRADKKPYSDAALAEMQKEASATPAPATPAAQAPAVAVAPTPPAATPPAAVAMAKPAAPKPAPADDDDGGLSWMWPAEGKVVATFDEGKSKGIDIAGKAGQPVVAAGAGKIMYAGSGIRGYGNLVIVKHSNNLLSAYAHNRTILVKEEQVVAKGQPIAEMGSSDADGVKLHFEIRQQGKPVDPARFLPTR